MAEHRISIDIAAAPERVFALWMDLDRMAEWVGGVTGVTDVTGPIDVAGTRYTVRFGPMKSPTEILEVDRPHHVRTRFGNLILKGESDVRFEPIPEGTRADAGLPDARVHLRDHRPVVCRRLLRRQLQGRARDVSHHRGT